jgi:hypothetical protein
MRLCKVAYYAILSVYGTVGLTMICSLVADELYVTQTMLVCLASAFLLDNYFHNLLSRHHKEIVQALKNRNALK